MHYKNGRETKLGDFVYGTTYNGEAAKKPYVGVIISITPGVDSCNCVVARGISVISIGYNSWILSPTLTPPTGQMVDYGRVGDLLHIEDHLKSLEDPQVVSGSEVPEL